MPGASARHVEGTGRRPAAVVDGDAESRSHEAGERALAEARFLDARKAFGATIREDETAEAREGFGWATLWLDEPTLVSEGLESLEIAHALYLERGDERGAARTAGRLAYCYGSLRGQPSVAAGWAERAARLADGLPPGPEHVWLAAAAAQAALKHGDTREARRRGRQVAAIARGLRRVELEAMGLSLEGRALVTEGEVAAGMRLLDEAAATALATERPDFSCVGLTCCTVLAACELTGDIERASEWCDRTTQWADRYGFRALFAICRTSYASVLIWRGRWQEAEAELLWATSEFASFRPAARGQAVAHLAELRRRQGRLEEAAELFKQVEGERAALLGTAALSLDQGDAERACDLASRYLRQTPRSDRAERAAALELLARSCLLCSRLERAREAAAELQSIAVAAPTEPLEAMAAVAKGRLAAAERRFEQAQPLLEDAFDLFSRCGAPYEAANARLALARVLRERGRLAAASDEVRAARQAFDDLGAVHGVELAARLAAGLEDASSPRGRADAPPPAGLTPRELEVLSLIAAGLSTREIAERLVISEHTVHRHTTNLYRKLGVSSRAAATAFAHRHGLA